MNRVIFLLILVFLCGICHAEKYLQCEWEDFYFAAEISSKNKEQVVLASLSKGEKTIKDARIFINGVALKYELEINIDLKKYRKLPSQMTMKLPIYHAHTDKITGKTAEVTIHVGGKEYNFRQVAFTQADASSDEPYELEPKPKTKNGNVPVVLEYVNFRYPIAGGIKVIHIKLFNPLQIGAHGMVRTKFKTKTLNPFCLYATGSIDVLGNYCYFYKIRSFSFAKNYRLAMEAEFYTLVAAVHTGIRLRYVAHAKTKSRRILVNKLPLKTIRDLKLHIAYKVNGAPKKFSVKIGKFDRTLDFDFNPFYPHSLYPRLARKNIFENNAFPEIRLNNTSPDVVQDLLMAVTYSVGKKPVAKSFTFKEPGEKYIDIDGENE